MFMMLTTKFGDMLVNQLPGKKEEKDLWFKAISNFHGDVNTPPMANFKSLIV